MIWMKRLALVMVAAVLASGVAAFGEGTAATPATAPAGGVSLKTDEEKAGYAIGLQIGARMQGANLDANAIAAGIKDAINNAKPQLTDEEMQAAVTAVQKKMQSADEQAQAANAKAGETFLAENAKKPGVTTTASGLQYKVNASGKGKTPKATDTVSVNYKGSLVSGKVFDESHGEPVTFPVNGVIPGWTEALQLMKEGDKWTLYIPAKLAYGENAPPSIGPNQVLVFDVELVSVK
jgi:FKBP-type peptidyl-prolyl cis-trans isomerase